MDFLPLKDALDALTQTRLPCADVRVTQRGRPLFEYVCGCADVDNELPAEPDTRYSAYSLTKLMTCACAMMAREEGLLGLDAPLEDFLPEFRNPRVLLSEPGGPRVVPAAAKPALRHLLSMSAGFGDDIRRLPPMDTQGAMKALARMPLYFEPGTRWLYGLCHDVLGAVLEKVYGLRLRELFRKKLYEPLGLTRTCFLSELDDLSGVAPEYKAAGEGYESIPFDLTYAPSRLYDSGGAGLVTSAGDFVRFLDALACGRLLNAESFAMMRAPQLDARQQRDFYWPQLKGYTYGLGLRVPLPGSGLTDIGWGGAAGAYALIDPQLQLSMCFFTNVLETDEAYLYPLLRDTLMRCVR